MFAEVRDLHPAAVEPTIGIGNIVDATTSRVPRINAEGRQSVRPDHARDVRPLDMRLRHADAGQSANLPDGVLGGPTISTAAYRTNIGQGAR